MRKLAASLGLGLLRRGDSSYLLHHTQGIVVVPGFLDLAINDALYAGSRHRHPVPCRSDAHQFALVSATRYPAGHHHVPFGYLILDAQLYIREGVAKHVSEFFDAFRAAYILRTCRIMAYKVRGENLVRDVQVPLGAKNLLTRPSCDSLVLFGHSLCAPSSRFPRRVWLDRCIVDPSEAQHMGQMHYFAFSMRGLCLEPENTLPLFTALSRETVRKTRLLLSRKIGNLPHAPVLR